MERCADPNCRRATKLTVYGAAPLQKVVFVFSGFNERTSFIFVAKNARFFVRRTRSGGADRLGTARSGVGFAMAATAAIVDKVTRGKRSSS